MHPAALRTVGAALLIGCWLLLGELGQALTPTLAGGLMPIAAWLACIGLLLHFGHQARWFRVGNCMPAVSRIPWRQPMAWPAFCARCAMLPMMATLPLIALWCGGYGLQPWQSLALHLSAMVLPPLAIRRLGRWVDEPACIAAAMALGVVLLFALPGLRGLMALSLCQSMAWGLASFGRGGPTAEQGAARRLHWALALSPALAALTLGLAIDVAGPEALVVVQVALSLVAGCGFLLGRSC